MKKQNKKEDSIQKVVLEAAVELAKKGEGALFIIGDHVNYEVLLKQKIFSFNVQDAGARKILVSIATIDGAVIISSKGEVTAYGAMIKKTKPFIGYGTRHAAAVTAASNGNTSILCSEEERKVKIFKKGKLIMQIDALQKNIEQEIPRISLFLETIGAGFLGTIGATALAPALGLAFLPGVIIFGASYFAIKKMINHIKG